MRLPPEFNEFREHQRTQPMLNLAAFLPLPRWFPRFHRGKTKATARTIRDLITRLTTRRMDEIAVGTAPDDLATKIMTTTDPETGDRFDTAEMVDQWRSSFSPGTRRRPRRLPGRSTCWRCTPIGRSVWRRRRKRF